MKDKRCPKCNWLESAASSVVNSYSANSRRELSCAVKSLRPGGAFIYKSADSSEMRAWMCAGCGYTEFYNAGRRKVPLAGAPFRPQIFST